MQDKFDLICDRFGRLKVVGSTHVGSRHIKTWICECDCGNITQARTNQLLNGKKRSCGCLRTDLLRERSTTHGLSKTKMFGVWRTMKSRCFNPNNKKYNDYGGRGITVCDEWANDFQAFFIWAMDNGYQEGLSIDRIDNDKGYGPENCRFVDAKTQCNNMRRTPRIIVNGVQYTAKELSEATGIGYRTILKRYRAGLNDAELIKGADI